MNTVEREARQGSTEEERLEKRDRMGSFVVLSLGSSSSSKEDHGVSLVGFLADKVFCFDNLKVGLWTPKTVGMNLYIKFLCYLHSSAILRPRGGSEESFISV